MGAAANQVGYQYQIKRLEADVDRLKAALKPFADAADFFEKYRDKTTPDQVLFCHETVEAVAKITLADLQAAKSALILD